MTTLAGNYKAYQWYTPSGEYPDSGLSIAIAEYVARYGVQPAVAIRRNTWLLGPIPQKQEQEQKQEET